MGAQFPRSSHFFLRARFARAAAQATAFVLRNGGIVDEDGYDNAVAAENKQETSFPQQAPPPTASNN